MKKLMSMVIVIAFILSGCTTATYTYTAEDPLIIRIADGSASSSPTGESTALIEGLVEEKSNNTIDFEMYASGVLGSERDTIELVQAGVLDMAKVGGSSLGGFEPLFNVFSLPFLFENEDHLYSAMTCTNVVDKINEKTYDDGYVVVGWYTSGARNFYMATDTPILKPEDLKGMKIRVMESATSARMVTLLGGSPVPMATSETYTEMQQGVIDGAENNELVLTSNNHMEIAKNYAYTQHQMVPDMFILSTKTLEKMTKEQQTALKDAIWENNLYYRDLNNELLKDARRQSEEAGVVFYDDIDKEPFRELVMPMHEEFKELGPEYTEIYNTIVKASTLGECS